MTAAIIALDPRTAANTTESAPSASRPSPPRYTRTRIPSVEKTRTCLRCGRDFLSLSSANRICPDCKAASFGAYADPIRLAPEERHELRLVIHYQLFEETESEDDTDDLDFSGSSCMTPSTEDNGEMTESVFDK